MVLTRRQPSQSSCNNYDCGGYEQDVNSLPIKSDYFYVDPENTFTNGVLGKKHSKQGSYLGRIFNVIQLVALIIAGYYALSTNSELLKTTSELTSVNQEYTDLYSTLTHTESELEKAKQIFQVIKDKMNSIHPFSVSDSKELNSANSKTLFDTFLKRHDAQSNRINDLQKSIQDFHLNELEER